jgi:hypothetical protein
VVRVASCRCHSRIQAGGPPKHIEAVSLLVFDERAVLGGSVSRISIGIEAVLERMEGVDKSVKESMLKLPATLGRATMGPTRSKGAKPRQHNQLKELEQDELLFA